MKKIIILLLFLSLCCTMLFSSCNTESTQEQPDKNNNTVTLYYLDYDDYIANCIKKFNRENKDIKIEATDFENVDELKTRMSAEMMAGKGPDLICANAYYTASFDYYKMMESNFADLNELINNDEDKDKLSFVDYNRVVMDAGLLGDKRCFIPMNYAFDVDFTVKETCEKYNIDLNEPMTYENIEEKCCKYIEEAKKNGNMRLWLSTPSIEGEFAEGNVDFELKRSNLNSEDFKQTFSKLLNMSKEIYKASDFTDEALDYDELMQGKVLMIDAYSPFSDMYYYAYAKTQNKTLKFINTAFSGKDEYIANVQTFLAINNNSIKKEEAYKFIKFCLSYDRQKFNYDIPVNNKAADYILEKLSGWQSDYDTPEQLKDISPDEFINAYKNMISKMTDCRIQNNYYIVEIVYPCISDYFEDKISEKECVDKIINKTEIYLTE